jgi:hypothetical protein
MFVHQAHPLVLVHDLLLQPWRQQAPITGVHALKAFDEARLERKGVANALSVQQSLDAVGVSSALLEQPLACAAAALAIFIFYTGYMDHAATLRLAPQKAQERPHHPLKVDPVGLGAPRPSADLDARRIDLVIDYALIRQPAM